ncbi:MAG TPA: VanZ family protein [Caulobacteraceae bacterium]|nr:VanZ family protein [Caulobacteraceae bacterium]
MHLSRRIRFVVFGLACAVVAFLSLIPQEDVPPTGISDRVHHLVAYGLLAVIGAWAYGPSTRLAIVLIAFGAAVEVLQGVMGFGRHADVLDGLMNTLGVILGLALALLALRVRRR